MTMKKRESAPMCSIHSNSPVAGLLEAISIFYPDDVSCTCSQDRGTPPVRHLRVVSEPNHSNEDEGETSA